MTQADQGREALWAGLLRAANAGDSRAYARFLQAVAPVMRGIVRARGPAMSVEDHEDIVQEVLIAIHTKRQTWNPQAPVLPWLYAIARYKVVDAFRRRGRGVTLPIADMAEMLEADPGPDPLAVADAERLIAQLDPRAGAIVRAVGIDGDSPAEVGARLSMSEGAVRVALHRALKRLGRIAAGNE